MKRLTNSVTMLCLIQLFFIGGGYLFTRVMLRLWDKSIPPGTVEPKIILLPRLIGSYGLWAAAVTALWCCLPPFTKILPEGAGTIPAPSLVSGILLTVVVALVFSASMLCAIVAFAM